VTKASDNAFPSILITEGTEPAAPAAGKQRVYIDSTTHHLTRTNSSGTETDIESAAANGLATDTLWDAAGDLVVGSGANTAAKLVKGSAGAHLSIINAAVAWNSGTSNPGSAVAGDRYWRTDLGLEVYYDGTRWLTTTIFEMEASGIGIAATADIAYRPAFGGTYDMWLIDFGWNYNITPTHTGTQFWDLVLHKYEAGGATDTTLVTLVSDKASTIWVNPAATAIGALLGTTIDLIYMSLVKHSTVSNINCGARLRYRLVIT
jgi:hypothetical protein